MPGLGMLFLIPELNQKVEVNPQTARPNAHITKLTVRALLVPGWLEPPAGQRTPHDGDDKWLAVRKG